MNQATLEKKINKDKFNYLQTMKSKGIFIVYCPLRGYIYEVVQSVYGCLTRVTVAIKNGFLRVLNMEPAMVDAA